MDALTLASRKYHVNVVKALIRHGADQNAPIDGGKSALEMMPELDESHTKYVSDQQEKLKKMHDHLTKQKEGLR